MKDLLEEGSGRTEDGFSSFLSFFNCFIVEPFGARLFETLHDLITELELPDEYLAYLKEINRKSL